jgi:hypothetical protein
LLLGAVLVLITEVLAVVVLVDFRLAQQHLPPLLLIQLLLVLVALEAQVG